jgi:phosphatidate cytidylyltransferase
MLKQRIITAAILAAVFFGALFGLSARHFGWFCLLLLGGAGFEWAKLSGLSRGAAIVYALVLAGLALALTLAAGGAGNGALPVGVLLGFCGAAGAFWLLAAPPWLAKGWPTQQPAIMLPLGVVLFVAMWLSLVALQSRSPWLLLGVMMIVWLADTGAYFAGRKFGRRKLAPAISPGKSWEGVIGGLVCVGAYALLVIALVPAIRPHGAIAFVCTLLLAGISVVGDLYESWLKRRAGVKDSGALLPGHGGILDRIDALMPVLPLAPLLVDTMS